MASIFSRIVAGEIPAYKIAETEDFLAFLDINPVTKGHCLCIPKREIDYIFDLPDDLYVGLQAFAREVARALEAVVPCERIATAVVGLEVPHCHIHLIPIREMADFSFAKKRVELSAGEMQQLAERISQKLADSVE